MPGARWFPGATLNYAEHVLRMPGIWPTDDPVVLGLFADPAAERVLTAGQLRDAGPPGAGRAAPAGRRPG